MSLFVMTSLTLLHSSAGYRSTEEHVVNRGLAFSIKMFMLVPSMVDMPLNRHREAEMSWVMWNF